MSLSWPAFDVPAPPDGTELYRAGGWIWVADSTVAVGVRCEMLPDGEAQVEVTLRDRVAQPLAQLEQAADQWDTLTAAQKDAAVRLAVRVVCRLTRLVLRRFDSTGG